MNRTSNQCPPNASRMLCCFILLCVTALAPAQKLPSHCSVVDVTSIGFPTAEKLKDAWPIHDLMFYNGRLYIGHGDAVTNTGPTDVIYYDLGEGQFVTEFTVDEEAIYEYLVVNNALMIPGIDATDDWSFGNFYVLTDTGWIKYRTIPSGIHVNCLADFNDVLYASTGALAQVGTDIEFAFGGIYSSTDQGHTWSLSYATPGDEKSVYRIYALIPFHEALYAFPFCYTGLTKEEIPEKYHEFLSDKPYDEGYYLILIDDILGTCDVLAHDGTRWRYADLIPEKNLAYVSKPFVFNDKLVMPALCGEYIDYLNRYPDGTERIRNMLFAFDGNSSKKIQLNYDRLIDVLVKDNTLYLLLEIDRLGYIAYTNDLKKWNYLLIPPSIEGPQSLEFVDNTFFIGTKTGNIFASLTIAPIKTIKDAQGLEPHRIFGAADLPRDGRWNWVSIDAWHRWGQRAFFSAEAKFGNIIKVTTQNIARMTIRLPLCHLSPQHPITLIINNMVLYEGKINNDKALVCTRWQEHEKSGWSIEPVTAAGTTYTKRLLGSTKIPLNREGDDPLAGNWKAEALRWFMDADCAIITQSSIRDDIESDSVYLEDIFDTFFRNRICTFTVTGAQLRKMIEANLQLPLQQRCSIAGFTVRYKETDQGDKIQECSLVSSKKYTVATEDFLMERSEQLLGQSAEFSETDHDTYDALIQWFAEFGVVENIASSITKLSEGDEKPAQ